MISDLHDAIFALYPSVVTARDKEAFDKDDNLIAIDFSLTDKWIEDRKKTEEAIKQTAEDKLAKLGLTPDDLKAILG
jgi:hypothetical protein